MANTVADLNIDMIGRVDPLHKDNPNFVYVVGSEMLSSQLKEAVEKANKATHNLYLDYKYDDPKDPTESITVQTTITLQSTIFQLLFL